MTTCGQWLACGSRLAFGLVMTLVAVRPLAAQSTPAHDIVAVGITADGNAVLLATPGLKSGGRVWRFRSLNTTDVAAITEAVLSSSGTKLFLQSRTGPLVVDLTKQYRHNQVLQYVGTGDHSSTTAHTHRLPLQRFVSLRDGRAAIVDDLGIERPEYPVREAIQAAIAPDGTVLYVQPNREVVVCGESASAREVCRALATRVPDGRIRIYAPSSVSATPTADRFHVVAAEGTETVIAESSQNGNGESDPRGASRAVEAALRAAFDVDGLTIPDAEARHLVSTLMTEARATAAAGAVGVSEWRFFRVSPNPELYLPVLELGTQEEVFPSAFELVEELRASLGRGESPTVDRLFERYLRFSRDERRRRCVVYFRTSSLPGSWMIEYWLHYPFDYGGFGSHLHDPEHIFVEIDKLGGAVRRVIGAGHGFVAGNNIYSADRAGAVAIGLPLFAIVEQAKHASAPDIDGDGVFTPGIDENEYRERAKIWGVRDVIGTINNQLISYDRTMSAVRRPAGYLASINAGTLFPDHPDLAAAACCRLLPLSDPPSKVDPCHEPTAPCAKSFVVSHPDYRDASTALKEWVFPHSFLRLTYGLGPRQRLHSLGAGFSVDLDRMPGLSRFLPLPGRLGVELFGWRQDVTVPDTDSCLNDCDSRTGVGWGIRFEQFTSNLFGIFSAVRVYSPPVSDLWVTFGPMAEIPLFNRANATVHAGLAFRPYASPRFELRTSIGVWKPRTSETGSRAASDDGRR